MCVCRLCFLVPLAPKQRKLRYLVPYFYRYIYRPPPPALSFLVFATGPKATRCFLLDFKLICTVFYLRKAMRKAYICQEKHISFFLGFYYYHILAIYCPKEILPIASQVHQCPVNCQNIICTRQSIWREFSSSQVNQKGRDSTKSG